jgi:hypothetical protein
VGGIDMKEYSETTEFNKEVVKERRIAPRFGKRDRIECISINSEKCSNSFKSVNISTGGIGFISPIEFKKNDFLEIIVFFDKSISIQLLLRIIRCEDSDGEFFVGAEFVGMLSCNYKILESVLDGCLDNC